MNRFQQSFLSLATTLLLCVGTGVASAATYFVNVTGAPSAITCTTTTYDLSAGATVSWAMPYTPLPVTITTRINGVVSSTFNISFNNATNSQPLTGGSPGAFTATFPYTVDYEVAPGAGIPGISVSFLCESAAAGGKNFTVSGPPILIASPATLTFGGLPPGSTSATKSLTITNTGNSGATDFAIANSNAAEFIISNNTCSDTLSVGASCGLDVAFKPSATGARSGTLTMSRAGGPGGTIDLTGTGSGAVIPGQLSLSGNLAFGGQPVGGSSAPRNVIATNLGGSPVTVSTVTSSNPAEFAVTSDCTSVAVGATCTISGTFTPSATGARSGTVTIVSNGLGSPQILHASGTGTAAPGQLTLPAAVSFGSQAVGTSSGASTVAVTNTGGSAVIVSSVSSSNPSEFPVTTNCATVAPGAGCTIDATFVPGAAGARSATITVVSDGAGSPQSFTASGTGTQASAPGMLSFTGTVDFPNVLVGASASLPVTVTNVGGSAVQIMSISSSHPGEFAILASTCGTLGAAASCTFNIAFSPAATGARAATIVVGSSGVGSPQSLNATGTGVTTMPPQPAIVDVIEYYHAAFDHYFVTYVADEIAKLDNGTFKGWARTGQTFKAFGTAETGTSAVCRIYIPPGKGDGHFFGRDKNECDSTMSKNPTFILESDAFFFHYLPTLGNCGAGQVPVYRLFSNRLDANHRYTTDRATRDQMVARGWIAEGDGADIVATCAPG